MTDQHQNQNPTQHPQAPAELPAHPVPQPMNTNTNMNFAGWQVQQGESEYYPPPPSQPPRPQPTTQAQASDPAPSYHAAQGYEAPAPPLPQRPVHGGFDLEAQTTAPIIQEPGIPAYNPAGYAPGPYSQQYQPPPPPQRYKQTFTDDDNPSNPVHYIRDPHKLIAYLVPFPRPNLPGIPPESIPKRFMIYTPPPPPLQKPDEDTKEGKLHKVQRKWQEEVRSAKTSTAKTASWKGVMSKTTRGIAWAMNKTTTSNLDFLGRVSPAQSDDDRRDSGNEGHETHKTVGVEEMVLIYPPTMTLNEQQMREEFVNTMLRTKSKAQRDTIIATGLLPVTYGIDILAFVVWPFGGVGEIDTVWAYASFRGAKTARSVTKRLSSASATGNPDDENAQLKLTFTHSERIEILRRYLDAECHKADSKLFPTFAHSPTESNVLEAIGWKPSRDNEDKNWEDEQWELREVKDDLRNVMTKAAREWRKWCKLLEKNPEKAQKK